MGIQIQPGDFMRVENLRYFLKKNNFQLVQGFLLAVSPLTRTYFTGDSQVQLQYFDASMCCKGNVHETMHIYYTYIHTILI